MKKKIIIAGVVLVVLAGGLGVRHVVVSQQKTAQTSSDGKYYNNEDANQNKGDSSSSGKADSKGNALPSRDEVVTAPESIYCLVNKEYSLPSDYVPSDLVEPNVTFSIDYESEKKQLRKVASTALEKMFDTAKENDLELIAVSGYRSYKRQKEIYEKNLKTCGTTHTNQYSAKPGYSEHQTGLVMDISCKSVNLDLKESFGETPEGVWVAENAHLYGYIIRYPEDKCEITGYAYEPWHLRYVGIPMATYLYQNNLTLDEYYHYKPSYDFITDESSYINDTPYIPSTSQSSSIAPVVSVAPSAAAPSTKPVTVSKAPVVPSQKPSVVTPEPSVKPSVEPSLEPVVSTKPVASEKPVASKKPVVKPSKAPAPSPEAPSPVPESPSPSQAPDNDDDTNNDSDESGE